MVCQAPCHPCEGPIECIFCQLVDALNHRAHTIHNCHELHQAINDILPNLKGFDGAFIHCGCSLQMCNEFVTKNTSPVSTHTLQAAAPECFCAALIICFLLATCFFDSSSSASRDNACTAINMFAAVLIAKSAA